VPTLRPTLGDSAALPSEFLSDLATLLTDELAIYMCLEGKGAIFSVKSAEVLAFGEAVMASWRRLTPSERAMKVVQWIHEAARYSRKPRIRWSPPAEDKLA
jgi:hypothetical protein